MVLHFERKVPGHTSANIFMIYHPVVPENLESVAVSTKRNLDGPSGSLQ